MRELFADNVLYVVPRFQRRYAWTSENWDQLWSDVVSVVDGYAGTGDPARLFLGAIVVAAESGAPHQVHQVVDGQQRLISLHLLAAAVGTVAAERKVSGTLLSPLRQLTHNEQPVPAATGFDGRLKLWPGRHDQAPFRRALSGRLSDLTAESPQSVVAAAYLHFANLIRDWLQPQSREGVRTAVQRLTTVLREGLQVVVIRLDPTDDVQLVFERLNARRLSLEASDFIRNHVFAIAQGNGSAVADWLYDEHWAPFDSPYWREPRSPSGPPRIDDFLSHFLVTELAREIPTKGLFQHFQAYLANARLPLDAVLARVAEYAKTYERLDTMTGLTSAERTFVERLRVLDISTMTPVVLRFFGALTKDERRQALTILDSYLVRRMIVGASTSTYGRVAQQIVGELTRAKAPVDALRSFLSTRVDRTNYWPDDRAVIAVLTGMPIANRLLPRRLRLVLKLVEEALRDSFAEPVDVDADALTVEHLMPVVWSENWPLAGDSGYARDAHVHRLGNLSLLTPDLNDLVANRSWDIKLPAIQAGSRLWLNNRLSERWNVPAINRRGRRLAVALCDALVAPTAVEERTDTPPHVRDAVPAELVEWFELRVARLCGRIEQETRHEPNALRALVASRGGLAATRVLLAEPKISDATQFVLNQNRPDLSVESLVLREDTATIFSADERDVARSRLSTENHRHGSSGVQAARR